MKTLLLVDDDPHVRRAMVRTLKHLEVEIREAINGQEALEMIRCGLTPALILSDIDMPYMNGFEFTEHRNLGFAQIPLILCSGGGHSKRAAELGVEYFEKGSDLQVLINRVKELIGS